jgi:hypothetical protein
MENDEPQKLVPSDKTGLMAYPLPGEAMVAVHIFIDGKWRAGVKMTPDDARLMAQKITIASLKAEGEWNGAE